MPAPDRGDVWIVDLGFAAKTRACLVLSVPAGPNERSLVTLVAHTTSLRGSQSEVAVHSRFLKAGVFDAQSIATVPHAKLVRKSGVLSPDQLVLIETSVRRWLGL